MNDDTKSRPSEDQEGTGNNSVNHEQNQSHSKNTKSKRKGLNIKIPQLDLRIFDHSFPYGLSLPSDVIKQVSCLKYIRDNMFSVLSIKFNIRCCFHAENN